MQRTPQSLKKPHIDPRLLWEYDLKSFDYSNSYWVVIERVISRGSINDWQEMVRYYPRPLILTVAKNSKQLSPKDKEFTPLFLDSPLLYALSE
jgi:hypothetical protein